uniref:Bm8 n=1 Tax=Brugia malayi TaxID=6279 RepID=A0A7I4NNG6_BRUMA
MFLHYVIRAIPNVSNANNSNDRAFQGRSVPPASIYEKLVNGEIDLFLRKKLLLHKEHSSRM